MKMIKYLLLLIPVLCITSCVQDEELIFDDLPAVRMQKTIDEYKTLLLDNPNGWIIHYYPEKNHSIGAYAMYWKFSPSGKVETACEVPTNVKSYETASSTWDVIPYAGPVLTFDTYNPVVHYFSEVTGSTDRDGRAGDYDFVIMKAVKDTIYLSGVKNKNKMVMFKPSGNPVDYLKQVSALQRKVVKYTNFYILQNGDSIGAAKMSTTVSNDLLNRAFTATYSNEKRDTTATYSYYYTPEGLVLQSPLRVNGTSVSVFTWDNTNAQYVAEGSNIVLKYVGPKLYDYEEFLGDYKLYYYGAAPLTTSVRNRELDISIIPEVDGSTYRITGILPDTYPDAKIICQYVSGSLRLMAQITYTNPSNGYNLWWLPYSFGELQGTGSYSYWSSQSTTAGVGAVVSDMEDNGGKLKFNLVDNKIWGTHVLGGFLIRNYNGSTSQGNVNGKGGVAYYCLMRFEKK